MKVSKERIVEVFDEVIAERGEDWVYPQIEDIQDLTEDEAGEVTDEWHTEGMCRYVKPDGTYACVWGGVITKVDDRVPLAFTTDAVSVLLYQITDDDAGLRMAACWSQLAQDRGMPYGQVKEGFHRVLAFTSDERDAFDMHDDLTLAGYGAPFD